MSVNQEDDLKNMPSTSSTPVKVPQPVKSPAPINSPLSGLNDSGIDDPNQSMSSSSLKASYSSKMAQIEGQSSYVHENVVRHASDIMFET